MAFPSLWHSVLWAGGAGPQRWRVSTRSAASGGVCRWSCVATRPTLAVSSQALYQTIFRDTARCGTGGGRHPVGCVAARQRPSTAPAALHHEDSMASRQASPTVLLLLCASGFFTTLSVF